jgi:chromosome segregation protein
MQELVDIENAVKPNEELLLVDAMSGQDAVNVANAFNEKLHLTGMVMSKLDGDARGGAALSIKHLTGIPIKYAGMGEKLTDLEIFHPDRMADRILGMGDIVTLVEKVQEEIDEKEKANVKLEEDKQAFKSEIDELNKKVEVLSEQIEVIQSKLGELLKQRDEIANDINELEKEKHIKSSDIERIAEQIESFKARRRELEPQLDSARQELEDTGADISKLEPVEISIDEINAKIQRLDKKMNELGDVNMRALTTYDEKLARQEELKEKIDILTKERKEILDRMSGYEQQKKEAFLKTYNNINENFKDVFHNLSEGEGELVLENPEDPLAGGLDMKVSIRDKKHQRLGSLSGGEKALTALAFVFAIQRYMPSPFYAFDEVDASLDTMNVERIAQMVQNQSKDTQFIVVSHRKPMIESANRTIGVTQKEKGITKVTGVKLRD